MLIKNYGLFWERDEIDWHPGQGQQGQFQLLGRQGKNAPGVTLCDFRTQTGLYVLYGPYGAYYVGQATSQKGLGKRLLDHQSDKHAKQWDRFSWFGFKPIPKGQSVRAPKNRLPELAVGNPKDAIKDMEALLIRVLGPSHQIEMNFRNEDLWEQVKGHERSAFLAKVGG